MELKSDFSVLAPCKRPMRGARSLKLRASSMQTPDAWNLGLFFAVVSRHRLYTWHLGLFFVGVSTQLLYAWHIGLFFDGVSTLRLYTWHLGLYSVGVSTHSPLLIKKTK